MGRAWTTQDDARFLARSERFESIEELKNPISNSEVDIVQLGRGRISGEIMRGQIDDIAFSRGHFSLPLRATGVFSRDKLVIATLLSCSGASRNLAEPVSPGDVLIHPAGSEHDRIYEGPAAFAGVMCDPAELPALFAPGQQPSDLAFWATRRHFRRKGSPTSPVVALLSLLAGRLQHGQSWSEGAAAYWKRAVLEAFLDPAAVEPIADSESVVPSSVRIVREVERYLEANGGRAIHVTEFCEKIKVRRRTLYRAFDEVVGTGPIDFLRAKRLSMVHLRLRQASSAETGVADIATEFGFLELGRFAQQYRALFGEHPRETLRRNKARPASGSRPAPGERNPARPNDLARIA
ncbi:helix-turn-helix domain-containing protein [Bradyrhizobium diazoefficiens]|nr:helix-turn-helix domain-containing protein [Bradyrhizobium diazoefficiens]